MKRYSRVLSKMNRLRARMRWKIVSRRISEESLRQDLVASRVLRPGNHHLHDQKRGENLGETGGSEEAIRKKFPAASCGVSRAELRRSLIRLRSQELRRGRLAIPPCSELQGVLAKVNETGCERIWGSLSELARGGKAWSI